MTGEVIEPQDDLDAIDMPNWERLDLIEGSLRGLDSHLWNLIDRAVYFGDPITVEDLKYIRAEVLRLL